MRELIGLGGVDREGTILRFTPNPPEAGTSRPQLPPGAVPKYPQGILLEINNGRLHVVFDEVDMWDIGDGTYRSVVLTLLLYPPATRH